MSDRATRILFVALGGLLLLAAVAAVLSATRTGPEYAEGSPEAVAAAYLVAAVAKDGQEAARHLDPASTCTAEHIEDGWVNPRDRVVLRGSDVDGDRATVRVDVVTPSSGPFEASEWTNRRTLDLLRVDGEWLISGTPWPAFGCDAERNRP